MRVLIPVALIALLATLAANQQPLPTSPTVSPTVTVVPATEAPVTSSVAAKASPTPTNPKCTCGPSCPCEVCICGEDLKVAATITETPDSKSEQAKGNSSEPPPHDAAPIHPPVIDPDPPAPVPDSIKEVVKPVVRPTQPATRPGLPPGRIYCYTCNGTGGMNGKCLTCNGGGILQRLNPQPIYYYYPQRQSSGRMIRSSSQ